MEQPKRAVPYKALTSEVNNEYFLVEEGEDKDNIKVVNKTESEVYYSPREFLTFMREHQTQLENAKEMLSEKWKEKVNKDIESLEKAIERIKPIQEEAEKKYQEKHEEEMRKLEITNYKKTLALEDLEKNTEVMQRVAEYYDKFIINDELRLNDLTLNEREKILRIKARLRRINKLPRR